MKNTILILALLIYSTAIAQIEASISNKEQNLTWIGKAAVGGYAPEGTLKIISGKIVFTSEEIIELSLVIDMKSLDQENTQLRDHLLEKDFFYVKKFPVATFILSEAVKIENESAKVSGKMTIKGKTQIEQIPLLISISEEGIILQFEHKMDRTKYGVNHNSPSIFKKLKENAIADEFVLKGTIKFKK